MIFAVRNTVVSKKYISQKVNKFLSHCQAFSLLTLFTCLNMMKQVRIAQALLGATEKFSELQAHIFLEDKLQKIQFSFSAAPILRDWEKYPARHGRWWFTTYITRRIQLFIFFTRF